MYVTDYDVRYHPAHESRLWLRGMKNKRVQRNGHITQTQRTGIKSRNTGDGQVYQTKSE